MNWQSPEDLQGSDASPCDRYRSGGYVSLHVCPNPRNECAAAAGSCKESYGLWVMIMCQRVIWVAPWGGAVSSGEVAKMGGYENCLCFPSVLL